MLRKGSPITPRRYGSVEANLALSRARAAAVIAALASAGIAPARMAPFGNGPYAPVASNANDDGRDRNRRVEFVVLSQPTVGTKVQTEDSTAESKAAAEGQKK